MLITKKVFTNWNSKTKKYYEDLGYKYTHMGDSFEIDVFDLMDNSSVRISVLCDYCNKIYEIGWGRRNKIQENGIIKTDCCENTDCKIMKQKEVFLKKYGVSNPLQVEEIYQRQRDSCEKSIGYRNPFSSPEIKEKIVSTNLSKYGETSFTKTEEYLQKRRETCLEKYGYEDHMQAPKYKNMFRGDKSPVWKGGKNDERWERLSKPYKKWRMSVFERDHFICQKCKRHSKALEAHHISNWKNNIDLRYKEENGITFCVKCHRDFHILFGKKDNTKEQVKEFIKNR